MKKVLVFTAHFPPSPYVAALRFQGLAKYLPEFGWEPTFITKDLPGEPDSRFRVIQIPYPPHIFKRLKKKLGLDPSKRLQEHMHIPAAVREGKRSFTNKLEAFVLGIINYPNKKRGWCPAAIKLGESLLKEETIDAIISSSPREEYHVVAKALQEMYKIPWIADFRDLWTQAHFYKKGSLLRFFERRTEIKTLYETDALVTVSTPLAEKLGTLHKGKKVFSITNGFDPEYIQKETLNKDFTLTYTGKLDPVKQNPSVFIQAIRELIDEKLIDSEKINIRFFGESKYWLEKEIKEYSLESTIHQCGFVPREVSLKKQGESQILLLFEWNDPEQKGVYTGKIFEYLAAKRPVLAVGGPKGVVSELLEQTKAGFHANDLLTLKKILSECYKEYNSTGEVTYKGIEDEINKYSHREMARKFAEVLDLVTDKQQV